jgi:hypothetical protein
LRVPIGITKEGDRNPKHWIALTGAPIASFGFNFGVDGSGNTYIGSSFGTSSLLKKINNLGALQFNKIFTRSGFTEQEFFSGFAIANSGNLYAGYTSSPSGQYISKRDSSGVEQWRKTFQGQGNRPDVVSVDASENMYVGSTQDALSPAGVVFVKLDSFGNVIWQIGLKNNSVIDGSGFESADGLNGQGEASIDSSGNIIFSIMGIKNFQGSGASKKSVIAKYNSSRTLLWQKVFSSATFDSFFFLFPIKTDSSNNLYACFSDFGPGSSLFNTVLVKMDPSGNILWQRKLFSGISVSAGSMTLDASFNIYISGVTDNKIFFVKYNSSGVLQWQRFVSTSTGTISFVRHQMKSTENVHIRARFSGNINSKESIILSLPQDGSVTGSYLVDGMTVTIAEGNISETAGDLPSSAYSAIAFTPPTIVGGDPGGRGTADSASSDAIVRI